MLAIEVDPDGATPPYEQVRSQIATAVQRGELAAGARLPTVRAFAEQLGLAANTVARAYRELEADGVLSTEGRRGTFVRSTTAAVTHAELTRLAQEYVAGARRLGLTRPEATRLVEDAWTGDPSGRART